MGKIGEVQTNKLDFENEWDQNKSRWIKGIHGG